GAVMSALYARSVQAERRALAAEALAREEERSARVVARYMVDVFRLAAPTRRRPDEVTARQVLDAGYAKVGDELADQPLIQGRLLTAMGQAYQGLGLMPEAREAYLRALDVRRELWDGPHPELSESLNLVGLALRHAGDLVTAETLYAEALAIDTALSDGPTADLGRDRAMLGSLLVDLGRLDEAEALQREALETYRQLPDDRIAGSRDSVICMVTANLGSTLRKRGKLDDAAVALEEAVARGRRVFGDRHPEVATFLNNLAGVRKDMGQYARAEALYREVVDLRREHGGEDHPNHARALNNLASLMQASGRSTAADSLYRDVVSRFRAHYGRRHPYVSFPLLGRGRALIDLDRPEQASPLVAEAVAIRREAFPAGNWRTLEAESLLGSCFAAQGDTAVAESLLVGAYEGLRAALGDESRFTREARERLATFRETSDRAAMAAGSPVRPAPR
ncbi:tetratricopeptide repeat protein, partial [bacterium]|nr:tetratricopeptide repeat protein [bacterium]